jgi:hypothetical protein
MEKEVNTTLKIGIIEFLILFFIGLNVIGFFGIIPPDLAWIKSVLAAFILSGLFIDTKPTEILFGHENRGFDMFIVFSYLIYLTKDIVGGAVAVVSESPTFAFQSIGDFITFLSVHSALLNIISLYIGTLMIILISIVLAMNFEIKKPSLLHAVHEDIAISSNVFVILKRIFVIFTALEFFYLFVFDLIIQWFGMAVDDPIIFVFVFVLFFFLFRQRHIFGGSFAERFINKAESLENFCRKLIKMFHYKKTLPLAISGILVLHALTDVLVYLLPHILFFVKNSFYSAAETGVSFVFMEHSFLENGAFVLNLIAILLLLCIPLLIWFSFFYHIKLLFNKFLNGILVASYLSFFLLPYFRMEAISGGFLTGVNIIATHDSVPSFNPSLVLILSLTLGLFVFLISFSPKIDKFISGSIAIISVLFFAYYLLLWASSIVTYYLNTIILTFQNNYLLASILLGFFMLLAIFFYIFGYLFILSETIAEVVNEKWSNPIDEEIKLLKNVFHNHKPKEHLEPFEI